MKTLVIIGAARPNGHTRKMVDLFLENLDGEKEIIDAYRTDVKPCMDCRYCWKTKACVIKDGMQDIYQKIEEADNILLASPHVFPLHHRAHESPDRPLPGVLGGPCERRYAGEAPAQGSHPDGGRRARL